MKNWHIMQNAAEDIQFKFPIGFKELEGIHSRTDFDLTEHQKFSGKKLQYFDSELNQNYVPYVIETSIGLDSMFLRVMSECLMEEALENGETRTVLRLPAALSTDKSSYIAFNKKDGLPEKAREIMDVLKFVGRTFYEEKDSIGKRYRRMDALEHLIVLLLTIKHLEDNTVTFRERDTMQQDSNGNAQPTNKVSSICLFG
jgi:glycyl-tRNA synthetase